MRKVLLVFLLIPGMVCAQVVYEDFESGLRGDWLLTCGERWEADSSFSINGKFSLHHSFDNSDAGCDRIGVGINGLRPSLSVTEWRFKIRHAYNPSSSNNWSFFLLSDEAPPGMIGGGTVSGFALGVNLSGYDDTLRLWKINGGHTSPVLSTSVNWQNDIGIDSAVALTVKRTAVGHWSVFIESGQETQILIGEGSDSELFTSAWAGLMFEYSSSQDRKLWIDDILIEGHIEVDEKPPAVDSAYFSGNRTLVISFDESLAKQPDRQCFTLMPGNAVPGTVSLEGEDFILEFEEPLESKIYYRLHIADVCDLYGNCTGIVVDSIPLATPVMGDIIISELMFDPEPPAGLPVAEYVEICNTSGFDLNTSKIKLIIGSDEYLFPAMNFPGGDHILITNEADRDLLKSYGKVICPDRSFSLNNSCDMVLLKDLNGELIHGLEYDIDWYDNQLKKYGGWSLEMIDCDYPFSGSRNWTESRDRSGGSPGKTNSVQSFNPDLDPPVLSNIYPPATNRIHLAFSETMNAGVLEASKWWVQDNAPVAAELTDLLYRSLEITLADSLEEGIIYEINALEGLSDMAANSLVIKDRRFGLPLGSEAGDIVFNEIMFDPLPGGSEFIEFYNKSGKVVDMSDLFIVTYDAATSDTGRVSWLSEECRCLMPGAYYVVTDDRRTLIGEFNDCDGDRIFEMASLPALPDKEGSLLLYNRNLVLIDRMYYSGDMHSAMLSMTGGISLERISADRPGTERTNWRSASAGSGYATPGIENSASREGTENESEGVMSLSSRKISPDNDGFEDYLRILVSPAGNQNIITVKVYNEMGYPVRTLADNMAAGSGHIMIWDGCDDRGSLVREGIYIIVAIILPEGSPPELVKKVCAVVYY